MSNLASGKLELDLNVQGNVWAAVIQMLNPQGTWVTIAVFTDLNDTVLTNRKRHAEHLLDRARTTAKVVSVGDAML